MSSKDYFNRVAGQWDKMRAAFFPETVRTKALAFAQVRPGLVAADLGAGTGFMTEALLEQGLHTIAVDQSEMMLAEMRKKFADNRNVEYRLGSAENLPLDTGSVDYVFANMYLHHVEDPPLAIREMTRILKPGGRLVITDLDEHSFEFLRTEQQDRWLGFRRDDIHQWFSQAGLTGIMVDCIDEECCAQSNCGCDSAEIGIFIAKGEKPQ